MLFSVGLGTESDANFLQEIIARKDSISEIYFSWGTFPSGRNDQTRKAGLAPWEAQAKQLDALSALSKKGFRFNLLFNANCYGSRAQSRSFFSEIGMTVDYVASHFGLASVTTTSPLIGKFMKQNFPDLDVRASVNMGIGTPHGMDYVAEYFDSFYVQREKNRDFSALQSLRAWCDANGKEMYLLANSGCLNDCSAHTFHDNLVAHEKEIAAMDNGYSFRGVCWEYYQNSEKRSALLTNTSYIRPEDTSLYEGIVPAMKLATRVHENPVRILRAYIDKKSFSGNLPSLLEPNHAGAIYPYILENSKIERTIENNTLCYKATEAFIRLEDTYADKPND